MKHFKRLDLILIAAGYMLVTQTKPYVSNVSNLYIICIKQKHISFVIMIIKVLCQYLFVVECDV